MPITYTHLTAGVKLYLVTERDAMVKSYHRL